MSELREAIEQAVTQTESAEQGSAPVHTGSPAVSVIPVPGASEQNPVSTPSDTAKPLEHKQEPSPPGGETPASVAKSRVDRPPQSWTQSSKALWGALPLEVRQEAHKRESEIMRGLNNAKPAQEFYQGFNQVVGPHVEWMQKGGYGSPMEFINNALSMERVMALGTMREKVDLTAQLLMDYNIDLNELDQVLTGLVTNTKQPGQTNSNEFKSILDRELGPLKQQLQAYQQRDQLDAQTMQTDVQSEIQTFGQTHDYFDELADEMADYIDIATKHGKTMTIEQAYQRAMSGHPEFQTNSNNAQLVNKVRQTGLSITGSPQTSTQGVHAPVTGSLREQISAAFSSTAI